LRAKTAAANATAWARRNRCAGASARPGQYADKCERRQGRRRIQKIRLLDFFHSYALGLKLAVIGCNFMENPASKGFEAPTSLCHRKNKHLMVLAHAGLQLATMQKLTQY
jgi:hypothetical protein